MKTRLLSVIVVAFAVTLGSSAPAIGAATGAAQGDPTPGTSVASVVGDRDGFGYGLPPGATRPGDLFNNRQLGDPDFTDVYPVPATYSPLLAVFSYEHQFDVPDGMNPAAAYFDWLTLGIQDGDLQVAGGDNDIRLFLDGVEVPRAFDTVDQFDFLGEIAGSVSINVPLPYFRSSQTGALSSSALRPVSDGVARVEARVTGGEIVTTCGCELECAPKLNAMKAVVARNSAR